MKRALSAWTRPPQSLQRPSTRLDNIVLVPASELASLAEWQRRARNLPSGDILMVLPTGNERLRALGRQVRRSQAQRGRHAVITLLKRDGRA